MPTCGATTSRPCTDHDLLGKPQERTLIVVFFRKNGDRAARNPTSCGCFFTIYSDKKGIPMALSQRMQDLLDQAKLYGDAIGFRVVLHSGERTCEDQKRVNPNGKCSYHLTGDAVDISFVPTFEAGPGGMEKLFLTPSLVMKTFAAQMIRYFGFRWGGDFRKSDPNHFDDGLRVGPAACCDRSPNGSGLPVGARKQETRVRKKRARQHRPDCRCFVCVAQRTHRARRASLIVDESAGYEGETFEERDY